MVFSDYIIFSDRNETSIILARWDCEMDLAVYYSCADCMDSVLSSSCIPFHRIPWFVSMVR